MKKYEVPVMKLHMLKTSSILAGSPDPSGAKETSGESSTQSYEYEGGFNGESLYED
jgi:hypothetical protein